MTDRCICAATLFFAFATAAFGGCASRYGEGLGSRAAGGRNASSTVYGTLRPDRGESRAGRANSEAGSPAPAPLPSGQGSPGKLLIFSSITGHVLVSERTHGRTPAEREAALTAELEAQLERERNAGIDPGDVQGRDRSTSPARPDPKAFDPVAHPLAAPLAPVDSNQPLSKLQTVRVSIPAGSWGNGADLEVLRSTLDVDGDGKVDEIHYFSESGLLVRKEEDRDGDGQSDAWSRYENGRVVERSLDSNGDERRDTWEYYAEGRMTARQLDTDHDGERDLSYLYSDGWLSEKRQGTGNRVERIELFEHRHRVRLLEDTNGDGRIDTWTIYRFIGGQNLIARIEHDALGRGSPTVFETFEAVDGKAVIARREEDVDGDGRIDDTLTYENGEPLRRQVSERVLAPL